MHERPGEDAVAALVREFGEAPLSDYVLLGHIRAAALDSAAVRVLGALVSRGSVLVSVAGPDQLSARIYRIHLLRRHFQLSEVTSPSSESHRQLVALLDACGKAFLHDSNVRASAVARSSASSSDTPAAGTEMSKCVDVDKFFSLVERSEVPASSEPSGLVCTLLPFQRRALTWMLRREDEAFVQHSVPSTHVVRGEDDCTELHPLFTEFASMEGGGTLYRNRATSAVTTQRFGYLGPQCYGGLLCQSMGLGKTVEMLALVLAHRASPQALANGALSATLLVCPKAILGQWILEIRKHAPSLRAVVYNPEAQSAGVPVDWSHADIVLVTYAKLRQQIYYLKSNALIRERKRMKTRSGLARQHPTPLMEVCWWRVVLDEAQAVCNPTLVAQSAMALNARNRWVVTGTPVSSRLRDLSGLLAFIGVRDLGSRFWFERALMRPFGAGDSGPLLQVLRGCFFRHSHTDIADELSLPALEARVMHVTLTPIEEALYERLYSRCQTTLLGSHADEWPSAQRKIMPLLLRLRQVCCIPVFEKRGQVQSAVTELFGQGEVLPMPQIKKNLVHEANMHVEAAKRNFVKATNSLAMVLALEGDLDQAEDLYGSSLKIAEDALGTAAEQEFRNVTQPCGSDDSFRLQLAEAVFLETQGQLEVCLRLFESLHRAIEKPLLQVLSVVTADRAKAKHEVTGHGISEHVIDQFGLQATQALLTLMLSTSSSRIECAQQEILAVLEGVNERIEHCFEEISTAVAETTSYQRLLETAFQVPNWQVSLQRRNLLIAFIGMRCALLQLFLLLLGAGDGDGDGESSDEVDDDARGSDNRAVDGADDEHVTELQKQLVESQQLWQKLQLDKLEDQNAENYFRTGVWNCTWMKIDPHCLELLMVFGPVKSGQARVFEKLHEERSEAQEEHHELLRRQADVIRMAVGEEAAPLSCTISAWLMQQFGAVRGMLFVREQKYGYDETARALWERAFTIRDELSNEYKPAMQVEHFWQREVAPPTSQQKAAAERRLAEATLEARQRNLNFMRKRFELSDSNGISDDTCPICVHPVHSAILIRCGHVFCRRCLSLFLGSKRVGLCPVCRSGFRIHECFIVDSGEASTAQPKHEALASSASSLRSECRRLYGAKISELVCRLMSIRQAAPGAKSLVFSQWQDLLKVIRKALTHFNIRVAALAGNVEAMASSVSGFVNNPKVEVFLIPMKAGASGLTMVAAQHAFIMEPNLNPSLEDQAASRIHRIGQTQSTTLTRLIAPGSIEERIVDIQERRRTLYQGVDSSKRPSAEVWDRDTVLELFDLAIDADTGRIGYKHICD